MRINGFVRRSGSSRLWGMVLTLIFCTICSPVVRAQDRDDVGREVVKGLLRALIESQLEQQDRRRPRSPQPPRQQINSPNDERLRVVVSTYQQEAATLVALLNTEASRNFQVRRYLPDAFRLQATASALNQQPRGNTPSSAGLAPYQQLNNDWQSLRFHLLSIEGLSAPVRGCINRIERQNDQMCSLLGLENSYDSRALLRAVDILESDLSSLLEELRFTSLSAANRSRLSADIRHLRDDALLLNRLVSQQTSLTTLRNEYQTVFGEWQELRGRLDRIHDRTVSRFTARIHDTHATIHEILLLPFAVDSQQIQLQVRATEQELSGLYRRITLDHLLVLPHSDAVAPAADAALGTCQNLLDVVQRGESPQAVADAWVYLDDAWRTLQFYLEPLDAPDIRHQSETVTHAIETLQSTIGVTVAYDPATIVRHASLLHSTADHLASRVKRWQKRLPRQDQQLLASVDQLESLCRDIENRSVGAQNAVLLRQRCDEVVRIWQRVRPLLRDCQTEERDAIDAAAQSFTPTLIRLRTMLEE